MDMCRPASAYVKRRTVIAKPGACRPSGHPRRHTQSTPVRRNTRRSRWRPGCRPVRRFAFTFRSRFVTAAVIGFGPGNRTVASSAWPPSPPGGAASRCGLPGGARDVGGDDVGGRQRPLQADTGWWWPLIHFGTVLQRGQPRTAAASLLADFTITPKGVLPQRGRPGAAAARQIEIAGSIGHTVQSEAGSLRIA